MSKKFTIAFVVCLLLFIVINLLFPLTDPPAHVGVSFRHRVGFPFPVKIQNVQYTVTGPIVATITNRPWVWGANVGIWLLLSYRFSRGIDRKGGWWAGNA